jgi:hypothetical protein
MLARSVDSKDIMTSRASLHRLLQMTLTSTLQDDFLTDSRPSQRCVNASTRTAPRDPPVHSDRWVPVRSSRLDTCPRATQFPGPRGSRRWAMPWPVRGRRLGLGARIATRRCTCGTSLAAAVLVASPRREDTICVRRARRAIKCAQQAPQPRHDTEALVVCQSNPRSPALRDALLGGRHIIGYPEERGLCR